jgi:hypothetical protein
MKSASADSAGDSACTQVGKATERAATFIAGLFLCFGATLAIFIPASLESRIEYLFFIGVLPAVVSYLSGYTACLILGLSCKLCEIAGARCVRLLTPLVVDLVKGTRARVAALSDGFATTIDLSLFMMGRCAERYSFRRKAHRAYRLSCSIQNAVLQIACLLIRSIARFLIRLQPLFEWNVG